MDEEEISYKSLRKIQDTEKNSPSLSSLSSTFYPSLSDFIENLIKRLDKEESSEKKALINDEIQNIKKISFSIYEQREKKIILSAISKARGGNPDLNNLLESEKTLFDSILDIMIDTRNKFLENKTKKDEPVIDEIKEEKKEELEKEETLDENSENTSSILRINEDIPEFIGTDEKKYNLRKNDVVSIPEDMSATLTKRGVAKKIK